VLTDLILQLLVEVLLGILWLFVLVVLDLLLKVPFPLVQLLLPVRVLWRWGRPGGQKAAVAAAVEVLGWQWCRV
jgi:hypothetical protein